MDTSSTNDRQGRENLAFNPPDPIVPFLDPRRFDVAFNRFPLKHGWDALALARLFMRGDLSIEQKLSCFRFYINGWNIPNLYASLTRSGSHWSILGISLALDLKTGGTGNYVFDSGWYPDGGFRYLKLDWRAPAGERVLSRPSVDPVLFHTHHPYYRVRSARLKNMRIAIVLRPIEESMESKFFKLADEPDNPDLDDDDRFGWEKLVDDAIEFYNSWGDVIRWHPACRVFRYGDMLADPVDTHQEMTDFFGMNIPRECLVEAFSRITKQKMQEKFLDAGIERQTNVSYRSTDARVPEHRAAMIRERIRRRLVYDFGFDLGLNA